MLQFTALLMSLIQVSHFCPLSKYFPSHTHTHTSLLGDPGCVPYCRLPTTYPLAFDGARPRRQIHSNCCQAMAGFSFINELVISIWLGMPSWYYSINSGLRTVHIRTSNITGMTYPMSETKNKKGKIEKLILILDMEPLHQIIWNKTFCMSDVQGQ